MVGVSGGVRVKITPNVQGGAFHSRRSYYGTTQLLKVSPYPQENNVLMCVNVQLSLMEIFFLLNSSSSSQTVNLPETSSYLNTEDLILSEHVLTFLFTGLLLHNTASVLLPSIAPVIIARDIPLPLLGSI